MFATIIGAIIAIAGTAIASDQQNRENNRARNEAKSIADQNRRDTLRQQQFQNRNIKRSMQQAEDEFAQSKKMDEISMRNQQRDAEKEVATQNQSFLKQQSQNVLGTKPQEESFLYKRSLLSRLK